MTRAHHLAAQVCQHLDGWSASPAAHDHFARLRHETGAEFGLYLPRYPPSRADRIEIKGVWPAPPGWSHGDARAWGLVAYGEPEPAITVGAARTPAGIADEIRRRFLPRYLPLWQEAARRHTAALLEDDAQAQTIEALLELAPEGHRAEGRDHRAILRGVGDDAWHGQAAVRGNGLVELRLDGLPPDVALAAVALVAEMTR